MSFERFTDRARKVMQLANQEAQHWGHDYVAPEHLLLGLLKEGSGIASNVLKILSIDTAKIRDMVESSAGKPQPSANCRVGRLPLTPRAKSVVEFAVDEASKLQHSYVGTEHVLLGLLRDMVTGVRLSEVGVTADAVRAEIMALLGHVRNDNYAPSPKEWMQVSAAPSAQSKEIKGYYESGKILILDDTDRSMAMPPPPPEMTVPIPFGCKLAAMTVTPVRGADGTIIGDRYVFDVEKMYDGVENKKPDPKPITRQMCREIAGRIWASPEFSHLSMDVVAALDISEILYSVASRQGCSDNPVYDQSPSPPELHSSPITPSWTDCPRVDIPAAIEALKEKIEQETGMKKLTGMPVSDVFLGTNWVDGPVYNGSPILSEVDQEEPPTELEKVCDSCQETFPESFLAPFATPYRVEQRCAACREKK